MIVALFAGGMPGQGDGPGTRHPAPGATGVRQTDASPFLIKWLQALIALFLSVQYPTRNAQHPS